jgi:hypothetical protein
MMAKTHDPRTGRCTRCGETEPNHKQNCIHYVYSQHSKALDAIADTVLAYRPKARSKPAVQRKRRKTILEKQRAKEK